MQTGGNVEILGFTPVSRKDDPSRPAEAPPAQVDFEALIRQIHESTFKAYQAEISKHFSACAENAVRRALSSSHASVLGTFRAIGIIIATRAILLLALVGAFALAWSAMSNPTWPSIAIMISYVLLTVLPLVWLDRNGRRSQNE